MSKSVTVICVVLIVFAYIYTMNSDALAIVQYQGQL